MKDEGRNNEWSDILWRRPLTPDELERTARELASDTAARGDLELDQALSRVLAGLPDQPVASNFTARTVHAALRTEPAPEGWFSRLRVRFSWKRWVPQTALAAIAIGIGLLSYTQVQHSERVKLGRSVATISEVPALSPELLADFDAIRALKTSVGPDDELLRLLQ